MKNVFQNSSDSESESEPSAPPVKLKKFNPPTETRDIHEPSSEEGEADSSSSAEEIVDGIGFLEPQARSSLNDSILYSNSVGLKMMEKMGYKVGQTLGSGRNPNALKEPLTIKLKATRSGIGGRKAMSSTPVTEEAIAALRKSSKDKYVMSLHKATITKLQKFCFHASGEDEELEAGSISVSDINPMWRALANSNQSHRRTLLFHEKVQNSSPTGEIDSQLDDDPLTLLVELLRYSRDTYFYCPYCSVNYNDADDMNANCPGMMMQDHDLG